MGLNAHHTQAEVQAVSVGTEHEVDATGASNGRKDTLKSKMTSKCVCVCPLIHTFKTKLVSGIAKK